MGERAPGREHQACAEHSLITRVELLLAGVPGRAAPLVAASRDPAQIRTLLASEIETALLLASCMDAVPDRKPHLPADASSAAGERDRER